MSIVIVIMGVSGSGKTAVGRALAERLNCPFFDGDDFHPAENVAKMAAGIPLTDADRRPWLAALNELIKRRRRFKPNLVGPPATSETVAGVVACSALKSAYRRQLIEGNEGLVFVYLKGNYDLICRRMSARQDHYMKAEMLRSQFDDLEEPEAGEAIVVDIDRPVGDIVDIILEKIRD